MYKYEIMLSWGKEAQVLAAEVPAKAPCVATEEYDRPRHALQLTFEADGPE